MVQKGLLIIISSYLLFSSSLSLATVDIAEMKAAYKRPDNIPFTEKNPYTTEKYNLGEKLFFDPRISKSGITSCASCHNPSLSWTDGLKVGVGHLHKNLSRKTPTLFNLAWDEQFFWDGRAENLLEQVSGPILNPNEMNMSSDDICSVLKKYPEYEHLFKVAFAKDPKINLENISKALEIFVRKITSTTAPFDQWIDGNEEAISESAKRGFVLFNTKARCNSCHSSWRFSDGSFHDIGLNDDDIGRGKILPNFEKMQHAFKTVGLRDIVKRAPYMHNGRLGTLKDVIEHYSNGFVQRKSLSDEVKSLALSESEVDDLISFLESLNSEEKKITYPVLPR